MNAKQLLSNQRFKILLPPLLIFLVIFGIYWSSAKWGNNTVSSRFVYFDHLADAFLHGRLYLADPPSTHDLTSYESRWYVPFPPLAAVLMLPWVALSGVNGVNAIIFSIFFAAANAAIMYLLLNAMSRSGLSTLNSRDNLWLTLLFSLSSVHWYMGTIGNVYFIAQVCGLTFVLLATLFALRSSPYLAGFMLGLAGASRPHLLFAWVLLVGIAAQLMSKRNGLDYRALAKWALRAAIGPTVTVVVLLAYNAARFDDPFDFGYLTTNVAPSLAENLKTYGQFDLHFLWHNVWSMFLAGPKWDATCGRPVPDPDGLSIFLTTPMIIYLARAPFRSPLGLAAGLTIVLTLIPLLTYYNTGFFQFGYRFSLDVMGPVMVLLAVSVQNRITWLMRALIMLGVLVNFWGIAWWYHHWCVI